MMRATAVLVMTTGMFAALGVAHAASADRPDVHVGDRWSFQHTNALANEKDFTTIEDVVEVTPTEIHARERVKGKGTSSIAAFTREWNPIDIVSARYEPDLREWSFPLKVGGKWESSADKMLFANGKHGKFQLRGQVTGQEKITVPAGSFDTFRIELHIDAVGTDEDANIGNTVETYWYAPEVRHFIKSEISFSRDGRVRSKDQYELLEYSLR